MHFHGTVPSFFDIIDKFYIEIYKLQLFINNFLNYGNGRELKKMDRIIESLDPDQSKAVLSSARHLLIVAAPGSGKTKVLACRYARLVKEGVPESNILALTFTNRAAKEMKARIAAMLEEDAPVCNIGTFHSFCLRFLKKERPPFLLFGRKEQLRLLKGLGVKNPDNMISRISSMKNSLTADAGAEDFDVLALYQKGLEELNALDLDDLILETIRVLEGKVEPSRFTHILADEYQDINPLQSRLLKLLAGDSAGLFAIGDPDQAIYAFRGASLRSFIDFEKDYPEARIIRLNRNYRSGGDIVFASKALIENNLERVKNEITPMREGGEIHVIECADERQEAEFIVKEIERLMGGFSNLTVSGGNSADMKISDFAVLFRTNRQAAALTDAFSRSSVPYQLVCTPGPDFRDFLEHLKTLKPRGILLTAFIKEAGKEFKADEDLISTFVHAAELYNGRSVEEAFPDFIEEMLLMEPADNYDIKADKVSLMTLHMAKGLEFPVVFITGVEDGLIPLRTRGGENILEEERRLFYVGITRAKEKLYLLNAQKRRIWGETRDSTASPFLKEVPERFFRRKVLAEKKKVKRRAEQKGLFE